MVENAKMGGIIFMGTFFFPSCKVTKQFPYQSQKLQEYLKTQLDILPTGCCRANYRKLSPQDTALVICNNCAAILEESASAGTIEFVWDIIDRDSQFPFPDYHGMEMTVQDCWIAVEKRHV